MFRKSLGIFSNLIRSEEQTSIPSNKVGDLCLYGFGDAGDQHAFRICGHEEGPGEGRLA